MFSFRALFTAVLLLFFLQCLTAWIENIYRLSLVKLSIGPELAGIAFVLLPLLILAVPPRLQPALPYLATALLIAVRMALPWLGAAGSIPAAGLGVGAGLMLACHAFPGKNPVTRQELMAGFWLAIMASIALRSGNSFDASLSTLGTAFTALFAGVLLGWGRYAEVPEAPAHATSPGNNSFIWPAALGLAATTTLVYLCVMSPGVLGAWTGANQDLIARLVFNAWFLVLPWALWDCRVSTSVLVSVNLLFVGTLLAGILLHTPNFPFAPDSPSLFMAGPSTAAAFFIYAAAMLSAVLPFNVAAAAGGLRGNTPVRLAVPMVIAAIIMVTIILLLVFTYTWGYTGPVGALLRNRFYLPIALAGLVLVVSIAKVNVSNYAVESSASTRDRVIATAGVLAGSVFLLILPSSRSIPEPSHVPPLTILTYNMQQGSAENADQNYEAQCTFLKKVNADIVFLQESDTARPSGGMVNAPLYFAEELGYYYYYGPPVITGTYGTAILSRFPLKNPRCFFTYSDKDEIGTSVAEVTVGGRRITLFNNHPAGSEAAHDAHVKALVEEIGKHEHVISAGDYNFRQTDSQYAKLAEVLHDSWLAIYPNAIGERHPEIGPRGEALDMTKRIDHIFVSDGFKVEESYYVPAPESETDHPAHWSVLSWK